MEDSCLLIGEGTKHIATGLSKELTVDEALEHAHRKIESGLIPMVGRLRPDNFFYGIPNTGQLLTVCFCCTCCCSLFQSLKYYPESVRESFVRLEGLTISSDPDACLTCGECIESCFMNAISLQNGSIVHDNALCKGCGVCAASCPQKTKRIEIDDVEETTRQIYRRIEKRIQYK